MLDLCPGPLLSAPLAQREGHDCVAPRRAHLAVATGGDDDVLAAVRQAVGHRRGLAAGGQAPLPQLAAGLGIEGAEIVVHGGAILDDDALVVAEALARRHPESQRRGRPGTPAAVVVRVRNSSSTLT